MQCGNFNSKQTGVLKEWGDNHEEGEMMIVSGDNSPKEETRVNAKSPQLSKLLTKK